MARFSFRKRPAHDRPQPAGTTTPARWPVDPDLHRRAAEARRRIAQTRRQIERHALPDRSRRGDRR